jgi:hypothetical protein
VKRLLAVLLVPCALAAQGKTLPGWYIETRVVSRFEGDRAATMPRATERRQKDWRSGAFTRQEGGIAVLDPTGEVYFVTREKDKRMYQVNPRTQVVRTMVPEEMRRLVTEKQLGPDPKNFAYKNVGDGGVLLGHKTTRFELTTVYTTPGLQPNAAPQQHTLRAVYWIATDTTDPVVAAWLRERPLVAGDTAVRRPRGLMLRSESRTEIRGATHVSEQFVQLLRREPVDTMKFVVPASYRRVDAVAELKKQRTEVDARMKGMQSTLDEMRRLRASNNPADRAKLERLMDSTMKDIQARQGAASSPARGSVMFADTAKRPRRP